MFVEITRTHAATPHYSSDYKQGASDKERAALSRHRNTVVRGHTYEVVREDGEMIVVKNPAARWIPELSLLRKYTRSQA